MNGESLNSQVDRLAKFIMAEVPGEPSESQGAVDTAIRIIRELRAELGVNETLASIARRARDGRYVMVVRDGDGYSLARIDTDDSVGIDGKLPGINAFVEQMESHAAARKAEAIRESEEDWKAEQKGDV